MTSRPATTKIANCYSPALAAEQPGSGRQIEIWRDNTRACGGNRWIAAELQGATVERTTYHPELLAALDLASALGYTDAIAASEVTTHALAAACSAREGIISERECASLVTSLLSVATAN